MYPIRLRPAAVAELTEAWRWYEAKREGLGDEFRTCIDAALAEVARAPLMWPKIYKDARRRLVKRFPYAIIYLAEASHIEVLAVFHASRDPNVWRSRV